MNRETQIETTSILGYWQQGHQVLSCQKKAWKGEPASALNRRSKDKVKLNKTFDAAPTLVSPSGESDEDEVLEEIRPRCMELILRLVPEMALFRNVVTAARRVEERLRCQIPAPPLRRPLRGKMPAKSTACAHLAALEVSGFDAPE
eukprot:4222972-Pleurochrysis_carterae.AAC.2